jgi:hypothetical protein
MENKPFGKERGLAKVVFTIHFTVELIHRQCSLIAAAAEVDF